MGIKERRQKCLELVQRFYSEVPSRMEIFGRTISEHLSPSNVLVDAGCGSDAPLLTKYAPRVSLSIGIDLCSPSVKITGQTQIVVVNLEKLPIQTGISDMVISHEILNI